MVVEALDEPALQQYLPQTAFFEMSGEVLPDCQWYRQGRREDRVRTAIVEELRGGEPQFSRRR